MYNLYTVHRCDLQKAGCGHTGNLKSYSRACRFRQSPRRASLRPAYSRLHCLNYRRQRRARSATAVKSRCTRPSCHFSYFHAFPEAFTVSTRQRRRFFGGTDCTVTVSHLCRKCLFGPLSSHEPESNLVEHGFGSTLRERLLDHELRRLAVIAFDEAPAIEQRPGVVHQRRATADHDAIMRGVERGQSDVAK
jgi:hypothetical protein